jgi:hypothetical protein
MHEEMYITPQAQGWQPANADVVWRDEEDPCLAFTSGTVGA